MIEYLKDLLISLLGPYQLQYDSAGNLIVGLSGLDYAWLCSFVLFVICLIACFAVIRSLFVSFSR